MGGALVQLCACNVQPRANPEGNGRRESFSFQATMGRCVSEGREVRSGSAPEHAGNIKSCTIA